jgi:hypothetical protein
MQRKLYEIIARTLDARATCRANGNQEWFGRHTEMLERLTRDHMPSGGGFVATTLDLDASKPERLQFLTGWHHMNDAGYYDGFTYHTVTVTPSLAFAISLAVSGRNRNDIKDYIAEAFQFALTREFYDQRECCTYHRSGGGLSNSCGGDVVRAVS